MGLLDDATAKNEAAKVAAAHHEKAAQEARDVALRHTDELAAEFADAARKQAIKPVRIKGRGSPIRRGWIVSLWNPDDEGRWAGTLCVSPAGTWMWVDGLSQPWRPDQARNQPLSAPKLSAWDLRECFVKELARLLDS